MGRKKITPTKKQANIAYLKEPKKSPNTIQKALKSLKKSPKTSPVKRGRPKPQVTASAKSMSSSHSQEYLNNIDNDVFEVTDVTTSAKSMSSSLPQDNTQEYLNNNDNDIFEVTDVTVTFNNNEYFDSNQNSLPSSRGKPNKKDHTAFADNVIEENGIISYVPGQTAQDSTPSDNLRKNNLIVTQPHLEKAKDNRIKCKECSEWFPNRYFLKKHILKDHEGQLYECRVCSFNSVDPDKLKTHIMKLHVAKKEKAEQQENNLNAFRNGLEQLMDKKVPRKILMEDGVALGRVMNARIPFVCDLCNRIYTSKYSLERHVRCHTLEKPFACDICDFTTGYREHLGRHMMAVHLVVHSDAPREKYVPERKKKAPGERSYPRKRKAIARERFECAVCGMRSSLKTVLIDHLKTKHPNAHIESMNGSTGSKIHLISTAPKVAPPSKKLTIKCNHCSLIFHDNWKFKVHMRSHTGLKPFSCSVCGMKASSKMSVRDHVHRKHKDVSNAKIILKAISIDGTEDRFELDVPVREFKCQECNMVFEDNYGMKNHRNKEHPNSKPFSCDICKEKFLTKAAVIVHWSDKHPSNKIDEVIRKYGRPCKVGSLNIPKCGFCKKVFPYRSQLNIHIRLHTGERRFSCEHCTHRCDSKSNLESHIKNKHLGISDKPKKKRATKTKGKQTKKSTGKSVKKVLKKKSARSDDDTSNDF